MHEPAPYDPGTDVGKVRLLLSDIGAPWVFADEEIQAFLTLEGGVKLAAAQAIDTNATNQALAAKVFTAQDVSLDGAKLAAAMRAHAAALRAQAATEDADAGVYFEVIDQTYPVPELTEHRSGWLYP